MCYNGAKLRSINHTPLCNYSKWLWWTSRSIKRSMSSLDHTSCNFGSSFLNVLLVGFVTFKLYFFLYACPNFLSSCLESRSSLCRVMLTLICSSCRALEKCFKCEKWFYVTLMSVTTCSLFSWRLLGRSIFIVIELLQQQYCIFKMVEHDSVAVTSCWLHQKPAVCEKKLYISFDSSNYFTCGKIIRPKL